MSEQPTPQGGYFSKALSVSARLSQVHCLAERSANGTQSGAFWLTGTQSALGCRLSRGRLSLEVTVRSSPSPWPLPEAGWRKAKRKYRNEWMRTFTGPVGGRGGSHFTSVSKWAGLDSSRRADVLGGPGPQPRWECGFLVQPSGLVQRPSRHFLGASFLAARGRWVRVGFPSS